MAQGGNRLADEFSKIMSDAAGVAEGLRREASSVFKTGVDRVLRDADVVSREEFEAVREMAAIARDENEALRARVEALEAKLGAGASGARPSAPGATSSGASSSGASSGASSPGSSATAEGGRSSFDAGL